MSSIKLSVIGIGSLRCGPSVVASLATFFGERPLEIAFYDPDEERQELMCRFAAVTFAMARATHFAYPCSEPAEALEGAARAVLCADENGFRRILRRHTDGADDRFAETEDWVRPALSALLDGIQPETALLSLLPIEAPVPAVQYFHASWPPEPSEAECKELPHQLLRWIKGEEYAHQFLKENERSPLKAWLDDVDSVRLITRTSKENP